MDFWLLLPFTLNIIILVPVCCAMFARRGPELVFQKSVATSPGLEYLVASLWFSILAASIAGLFAPRFWAPVLVLQIIYKSLWLATHVAPSMLRGQRPLPIGVSATFTLIVAAWPYCLWMAYQ